MAIGVPSATFTALSVCLASTFSVSEPILSALAGPSSADSLRITSALHSAPDSFAVSCIDSPPALSGQLPTWGAHIHVDGVGAELAFASSARPSTTTSVAPGLSRSLYTRVASFYNRHEDIVMVGLVAHL